MNYIEACKKLHIEPKEHKPIKCRYPIKQSSFLPNDDKLPPKIWQEKATSFVKSCYKSLMKNNSALQLIFDRGFTNKSIEENQIGWNPATLFENRFIWGLPQVYDDNDKSKSLWLPQGILVPTFLDRKVVKLKIRRNEWHIGDKLPKYAEISGGLNSPSIYGSSTLPIIIVESELDALLIKQFAGDICSSIALGGASKRPNKMMHDLLLNSPLILLSLDHDAAGIKEYPFWMKLYSHLRPWPARRGKSPGDSHTKYNIDLRKWIEDGLSYSNFLSKKIYLGITVKSC